MAPEAVLRLNQAMPGQVAVCQGEPKPGQVAVCQGKPEPGPTRRGLVNLEKAKARLSWARLTQAEMGGGTPGPTRAMLRAGD